MKMKNNLYVNSVSEAEDYVQNLYRMGDYNILSDEEIKEKGLLKKLKQNEKTHTHNSKM